MAELLVELLRENDAPPSIFVRLGLPVNGPVEAEHLRAAIDASRAAEVAEQLPPLDALPARSLLETPVYALLADTVTRAVIERHLPGIGTTELITAAPAVSIIGMAKAGTVSATTLTSLATDLAEASMRAAVS